MVTLAPLNKSRERAELTLLLRAFSKSAKCLVVTVVEQIITYAAVLKHCVSAVEDVGANTVAYVENAMRVMPGQGIITQRIARVTAGFVEPFNMNTNRVLLEKR